MSASQSDVPRDYLGRTMAQLNIKAGNAFPYDASDAWLNAPTTDNRPPPPPSTDWAHSAARGAIESLSDRRRVRNALDDLDEEVRAEIVSAIADIIREAWLTDPNRKAATNDHR